MAVDVVLLKELVSIGTLCENVGKMWHKNGYIFLAPRRAPPYGAIYGPTLGVSAKKHSLAPQG